MKKTFIQRAQYNQFFFYKNFSRAILQFVDYD